MSTWKVIAGAALICVSSIAQPAFADLVKVRVVLPIDKIMPYHCGGDAYPVGTQCLGAHLEIPATDVDLSTDTLQVTVKFPDSLRLRWADDGITSPYADEAVSVVAFNPAEPISVDNGTIGMRLTFTRPAGDLLARNIDWNLVGSTGGILIDTTLSGISNLTDSSFSFSGVVAQMGPFSCSYPGPAPCNRPTVTINTVAVFFQSGLFSIIEPNVSSLFESLLDDVTGKGPGTSLADKVRIAQARYKAQDVESACRMLRAFQRELSAQSGKKLTGEIAGELSEDARDIMAAIDCS